MHVSTMKWNCFVLFFFKKKKSPAHVDPETPTGPESSPKKESQMQKWNMWEGWRSLIEIEDQSRGEEGCAGVRSVLWLVAVSPWRSSLGAARSCGAQSQTAEEENWTGAIIHSCGRCISEIAHCSLWHPPRTPASIFICSNLRVSDAALTRRSWRTAAHLYRGKSPLRKDCLQQFLLEGRIRIPRRFLSCITVCSGELRWVVVECRFVAVLCRMILFARRWPKERTRSAAFNSTGAFKYAQYLLYYSYINIPATVSIVQ